MQIYKHANLCMNNVKIYTILSTILFSVFISPCLEFRKSTGLSCSKAVSTNPGSKDNLLFYKIFKKNPNFLKQMLRTLCHDFPLIQDLFRNKHTISYKSEQALAHGRRTPSLASWF